MFPTCKATVIEPPVKARPEIDLDTLFAIHPHLLDESYMYVHCHFHNPAGEMLIRIWASTFLKDINSAAKTQLIHAENITYAPVWTLVPGNFHFTFLLIFSGLPRTCRLFDLVEDIPQPGGFYVRNIPRNDKDVYHVNIL